jgi:ABC-type amino acid transport substrate-binding protein
MIAAALATLLLSACADDAATTTTAAPATIVGDTTTTAPPTTIPQTTTTVDEPVEVTVTGVVIDVVGGLAGIDSFKIRLEDGSDVELTPGEGVLFDDVAPISHLQDHLVSGAPVTATYLTVAEGLPVVIAIGDAAGTHSHDG